MKLWVVLRSEMVDVVQRRTFKDEGMDVGIYVRCNLEAAEFNVGGVYNMFVQFTTTLCPTPRGPPTFF